MRTGYVDYVANLKTAGGHNVFTMRLDVVAPQCQSV